MAVYIDKFDLRIYSRKMLIECYNNTKGLVATISFADPGSPPVYLKSQWTQAGIAELHYPLAQYNAVIELLRNDKTVAINENTEGFFIGSIPTPVG